MARPRKEMPQPRKGFVDLLGGITERLRATAIDRLSLRLGDAVLDLGCGGGLNFELLEAAVGPQGRIVALDLRAEAIAAARELVTAQGWTNVTFIESAAEAAPLERESVDAVLAFFTPDILAAEAPLATAVAALRTGGRFVAAGAKRVGGPLGLVLNPLASAYALPEGTTLSKEDRPWAVLAELLGGVEVEEQLGATAYVARGMKLSLPELARRTGESLDRLGEWRSLGLLGDATDERVSQRDVERVRLVQLLLRRGTPLDAIVAWAKAGEMDRHAVMLAPQATSLAYTLAEAATRAKLPIDVAERIWAVLSPMPGPEVLTDEDVEALRMVQAVIEAGFPPDAVEQMARVSADALGRVADTQARLFHFHIRRSLQARGKSGETFDDAVWTAEQRLVPVVEPLLLYCHRNALRTAIREAAVVEVAERTGIVDTPVVPDQVEVTVVFVDLSSFTALASAMGDVRTAEVLDRFSALVRQAVRGHDGRVVKQIGDAFMLVFHSPIAAVECALEIDRLASSEPQFPAVRSGVHCGPVLYRDGDYVGANVNLAARLTSEAERHQVVVSAVVRQATASMADVEFVPLSRRRVKGVAEELDLYVVRPRDAGAERTVDPVCGMELGPSEIAARLTYEGRALGFCSEQCLQRYVASPRQYGGSADAAGTGS